MLFRLEIFWTPERDGIAEAKRPKHNDHSVQFSSVAQSCLTLRPHESHHARSPCPSPTPRDYLFTNRWGNNGNSDRLSLGAAKSLQMVTAALILKDTCSLEEKL